MFRRRPTALPSFFSGLILALTLAGAQPVFAQGFEGSAAEDMIAKGLDAVLIRPLATARVIVGAAFLVPASLFAAPGGLDSIKSAYEVLVDEPVEFAFKRELGDF
jgi:hypothetical protein